MEILMVSYTNKLLMGKYDQKCDQPAHFDLSSKGSIAAPHGFPDKCCNITYYNKAKKENIEATSMTVVA